MGKKINKGYVLHPFNSLIANCQSNVLLGLRIIEKVQEFPEPTVEEQQFFQLSMGYVTDMSMNREQFKKWVLINGFEDIHKCLRVTLERLYVLKYVEKNYSELDVEQLEIEHKKLQFEASNFYFDLLTKKVDELLDRPLDFTKQILSFNNARNCLIHTNGRTTVRHCNNAEKNILTIYGRRFKLFHKRGELEIPVEFGKPGPENASIMLGAEDFEIIFPLDSNIQLNLKQFLDILNTCIFIKADIDVMLDRMESAE